jgi:Tfp pilus assembly protein PilF
MWEHAIRIDPDNHWAHFYLAHIALSEGDPDAALRSARIAAERAPTATAILERVGAMELMFGNYAAAEPPLRVVVRGDPSREMAPFLLAEVCRQTGRPDEANALFARAVEVAKKNGHTDIAARAQHALDGGEVTDLSDPVPVIPMAPAAPPR